MSEATTTEAMPKRKSALPKLLALVVLMLVVAVVVNWKDINAIAQGQRTVKSVLYGKKYSPIQATFRFPEPLGPDDAKVKVQVVAQEGNSCHEPVVALWMGIADLEPKRLRVEFSAYATQEGGEGTEPRDIGCESGVLINGQNKFVLGEGEEERTIYLLGPDPSPIAAEQPVDAAGMPPQGHGWTLEDVATIVNQAIEKEYGEKAELTAQAIKEAWEAAHDRIPRPEPEDTGTDAPA